jgi:polyamine oxidase
MTAKPYDVVIVGAGMAGLAAAAKLRENDITNIIVLEAQDYIGGRVKTVHDWGAPIALGAEFIHGDKTITADIARKLNLPMIDGSGAPRLINANGVDLSDLQQEHYHHLLDFISKSGKEGVAISQLIDNNPYTQDPIVKQLVSCTIGDYEAGEVSQLDSGAFSKMIVLSEHNGKNVVLESSYPPIIDHLSISVEIRTGAIVTSIDQSEQLVMIELHDGTRLSAHRVIVTVSLGVLKSNSISFTPQLPREKINSIERLGMGNVMKLILRFDDSFDVQSLFGIADGENETLQTITCWWASANSPNVLVGYAGGLRADKALAFKEHELLSKVMADLNMIAGKDISNRLIDHKIARWDDNPFTLGAYTNHPLGSSSQDNSELARPNGTIFWAGEATDASGNYATVHGAIASGIRAANEILSATKQ